MGEVWYGWDSQLNRPVALKFLKYDDPDELARFQREAQTAARLNHPNIGAVYEVGENEGKHFIALQYIDGQTLQAPVLVGAQHLADLTAGVVSSTPGKAAARAARPPAAAP